MKTTFRALFLASSGFLAFAAGCGSTAGDADNTGKNADDPAGAAVPGGASTPVGDGPSTGAASGNSDKDVAAACAEYAAAECHKIAICNPWYIAAYFEDEAACVKRFATAGGCVASFASRGSSRTVASLAACAAATQRSTCAEWLDGDATALAACIAKPGSLANGTGCGDDAQCQSGHCRSSGQCGVCGPTAGAGDTCRDANECSADLSCKNGVCVRENEAGDACDGPGDCPNSLVCNGGRCGAPKHAGEICSDGSCDAHAGLYCAEGVCRSTQYVAPGRACDWEDGIDCAAGGFCRLGESSRGSCVLPAQDGEPCDEQNGPTCLPWATCTDGYCKVADPAACR